MNESIGQLHREQQLFIINKASENAKRINQLSLMEDTSFWSDTQSNGNNLQFEVTLDQGKNKLEIRNPFQSPKQKGGSALLGTSAFELQRGNTGIDSPVKLQILPKSQRQSVRQESTTQNRRRSKSEAKFGIRFGVESDNEQNLQSKYIGQKQIDLNKRVSSATHTQLKIMLKLKQKLTYFYRNFTLLGRTKQLNNQIKSYISDKSDVFENQSRISAFANRIQFLQLTTFICKGIRLPIISYQSNIGITISLIFIIYNCLFLLIYSIYLVFTGFDSYYPQLCFVSSLVWSVEILIKLNTSIFRESKIVLEREKLVLIYMKSKFIFDLIPMMILVSSSLNRGVQLFTLLKIFNITSDLGQFQKYLCRVIKKYYFVILINLILKMFLIAHILACMWYLLALIETNVLGINSWDQNSIGVDGVWWKLYFQALYWALTLMTTGSNIAETTYQIIFTSFIMIFTTIAFGYLLSVVGYILETIDEQDDKKRKDLNIINEFMREKHISQQHQFYSLQFH